MEQKLLVLKLVIFFIMLTRSNCGRPITDQAPFEMVSDGVHDHQQHSPGYLNQLISTETCTETYGFLPCTTTILGNVFLIIVYAYLMFLAAKSLSAGSEILLQILGPGVIGGLFLPVLNSLPDAAIILASGLSVSKETAQTQVSVGMGLLAGSTVMLLTILWGSCLIVGKCDLENSVAVEQKDTKGFSITGSGMSTDIWTSYAARIMIISVIPFVIVQLPQVLHGTAPGRLALLISLLVSISLLVAYCLYQIFQPWIQRRRFAYVKHKHIMSGLLEHLKTQSRGRFLKDNDEPDTEVIQQLFENLAENSSGYITTKDLRALMIGMHFEGTDMEINDAVVEVMLEFDESHDSRIDMTEFVKGITKWVKKAKHSSRKNDQSLQTMMVIDRSDETPENVKIPRCNRSTLKAFLLLLLGAGVAAAFADPLVDAVDNFSTATDIPSFFISFVILPLASSSEIVSALIFASQKKIKTASLTYSEIYGSVTVSNTLSLAVFLGLVYMRNLTWTFSSEVLIILIVCIIMGSISSFRTTFSLWLCILAYALYPLSLLLVFILKYVAGWT